MFKEPEKGTMDINILRTKDALETKPNIIATGCPYCNTMMTDGIKFHEKRSRNRSQRYCRINCRGRTTIRPRYETDYISN